MGKNKYLLFICILAFIHSCETDLSMPSQEDDMETVTPTGEENYLNLDSDYIFDQGSLHTYELFIPQNNLAIIDSDPAAEQYVEGSLTFQGETISPVGVRYKGKIGAFVGCVSGTDWTNPSGHKTCTKLSMKVKINWKDTDDKFYGLKKLQFHSQNLDPTQMRERLGYWLFRKMGVPAPRSVHARLIINGSYSGIYALTEQIDGRFTRYHFDDGKGNLYKEIWPVDGSGQPYSESTYLNHLETNEEDNPTAEIMRSFGLEISGSSQENIGNIIQNWMDLSTILAYIVVDRMIRHDDGPFHWYCGGGGCSNHNYYWYEEPTQKLLYLIPWDLDNAFENIVRDQNPVTPIADEWGEVTANCSPFSYGSFQFQQRSAACDKLTAGWAAFQNEYDQLKSEFVFGPFSASVVDPLLETWTAQIKEATAEAHQFHNDALPVSTWEAALADLKESLEYARNN